MAERATADVVGATTTLERVTPRPGALSLVRARYAQLPGALQRVAETVLLDPSAAAGGTIVELAERSGTSASTVIRFCHALGFDGLAGLRLDIAAQISQTGRLSGAGQLSQASPISEACQPNQAGPIGRLNLGGGSGPVGEGRGRGAQNGGDDGPIGVTATAAVSDGGKAFQEKAIALDPAEVARAAEVISRARHVEIYAATGSSRLGEQICKRLGIPVSRVGRLGPGDVAMAISNSGHTPNTVARLAKARALGAKTIALTSFPHSPLARLADIVLLTAALRPQALAARHPQLVALDLLRAAVAQRIQGLT